MLGVMQLHPVAHGLVQLLRDRLVSHAEIPQLRGARTQVLTAAVVQRDFAFLRFANPAAAHEFLQHTRALAIGIGPGKGQPGPKTAADDDEQQQNHEPAAGAP